MKAVETIATAAENGNANSRGRRMSLEVASRLFDWSSIALAIGACIVFVATAAIVWFGIVKEHHWDVLREQANAKIASVGLEAAKSNAEAAKAHERIAELTTQAELLRKDTADANARAVEAQLTLEKLKTPRSLSRDQMEAIANKLRPFAKAPFDLSVIVGDPEAIGFLGFIADSLESAGWTWTEYNHPSGPFMNVYNVAGKPNIGQQGWMGVSIQVFDDHAAQLSPAADALLDALKAVGVVASRDKASDAIPNHDTVHVLIGRKPL
jgi:hypothetical protein